MDTNPFEERLSVLRSAGMKISHLETGLQEAKKTEKLITTLADTAGVIIGFFNDEDSEAAARLFQEYLPKLGDPILKFQAVLTFQNALQVINEQRRKLGGSNLTLHPEVSSIFTTLYEGVLLEIAPQENQFEDNLLDFPILG